VDPLAGLGLLLCYLALHLVAYIVVLRKRPLFSHEHVIFGYHAVSLLVVCLMGLLVVTFGALTFSFASFVAALALHGMYSTSFLELWSLAEGGYSLTIMRVVQRTDMQGGSIDLNALQHIGMDKREGRLAGLVRMGLIKHAECRFSLTPRGRATAAALRAIGWAANLRPER
jgi:hypothetical protein